MSHLWRKDRSSIAKSLSDRRTRRVTWTEQRSERNNDGVSSELWAVCTTKDDWPRLAPRLVARGDSSNFARAYPTVRGSQNSSVLRAYRKEKED